MGRRIRGMIACFNPLERHKTRAGRGGHTRGSLEAC